jgi:hypothetical protein
VLSLGLPHAASVEMAHVTKDTIAFRSLRHPIEWDLIGLPIHAECY